MPTVTISPKYQVVIPKEIREQLGLSPGQEVQVIAYGNRIEFIPVRPINKSRGLLEGIDTRVYRDGDRVGTSSIPAPGSNTSPMAPMRHSSPGRLSKSKN